MKRRDFLKTSVTAAAGMAAPFFVPNHVFGAQNRPGANDKIVIGFIGLGGRARWLLQYEAFPEAQIVAAAKEAGALGFSLSGSGPSVFAVAEDAHAPAVREAMTAAFAKAGLGADAWICTLDRRGARCLTEGPCAS